MPFLVIRGNANQNDFEISSYPSQNGKDHQNNRQMLEGMWAKGELHPLLVGLETSAATTEIGREFPKS